MSNSPLIIAIMAGGLGKRMNSDLPKVLHLVGDSPILVHVIRSAIYLGKVGEPLVKIVIIVGKYAKIIQETLEKHLTKQEVNYLEYAYQEEPLGTGHAVQQILPFISQYSPNSRIMILSGDVPLIRPKTLLGLLATYDYSPNASAVIITTNLENPTGNGRILRDNQGNFLSIVEEKDCANIHERSIHEVNAGIYLFHGGSLSAQLPLITNNNNQKEFYLPDVLPLLLRDGSRGKKVISYILDKEDQYELLNVNDQEGLKEAQKILYRLHK